MFTSAVTLRSVALRKGETPQLVRLVSEGNERSFALVLKFEKSIAEKSVEMAQEELAKVRSVLLAL